MTREKILKLIKGLNRFYPDDLVITSEEDEKTVLKLLDEFLKQGIVKRLDNEAYLFVGKTNSRNPKVKEKRPQTSKMKFIRAANKFLSSSEVLELKKPTIQTYKTYINAHLIPYFKNFDGERITESVYSDFVNKKVKEGLGPATINKILLVLKKIAKIYDPGNFVDKQTRLKINKEYYQDIRILNIYEIKQLLKTCEAELPNFYPLLFTAISTGLTRGEILGLTWDRLDFDNQQIKVDRSLYRGEFNYHKAVNSIRQVDISLELLEILKVWEKSYYINNQGYVFPNSSGEAQDPDNMMKRFFNPIVKSSGIRRIRFSDLRDTYASLLIKQGLPLSYIQIQLGHSSVNVTYERYKRLLNDKPKKLVSLLNPSPADTDAYLL